MESPDLNQKFNFHRNEVGHKIFYHISVQDQTLFDKKADTVSYFFMVVFIIGHDFFQPFPFPPSTFCTICKFICTFEHPAFIA